MKGLTAFEVEVDGKALDYRVGGPVDTESIRQFFSRRYDVRSVVVGDRHTIGVLGKDGASYIAKVATSPGIGVLTENEKRWNDFFNARVPRESSMYWVPRNVESGRLPDGNYYLVTEAFAGILLAKAPQPGTASKDFSAAFSDCIGMAELIESLPPEDVNFPESHTEAFLAKVQAWYDAIPYDVCDRYAILDLLSLVKRGAGGLRRGVRHGDFAPWHIMRLANGKLGLIDGEHFREDGVRYYDIAFFTQRVFGVLNERGMAEECIRGLISRGYAIDTLRVVLASRAIGGYLDASLALHPDYSIHNDFSRFTFSV